MLLSLLLHGDPVASTGFFGYDAPRLHAVINDFPPALLVVGVFFELAYLYTKRESLRNAAYWSLIVGAVMTGVTVFSGLRAEDAIQHGEAIHEIMEVHEKLAWVTLGFFGVVAAWRLLRESKMGRGERWAVALIGVVGLGFLVATGREGGEMTFDHGAGMTTAQMEAEIKDRAAGHQHEEGDEDDDHEHADSTAPAMQMDSTGAMPAAATDSAAAAAKATAPTHTHAPGTPPHKD
jgi:uncharacterized membrane protein